MARVTHVKRAQPRYKMVLVTDPDTGGPKRTPVINKRTGEQKVTKTGRPVLRTQSVADKTKPLPLLVCDAPGCGKPIEIGSPYKHITPKSGPYGGRQRNRHEGCPTWQVWEYSSSMSARISQIEHEHGDLGDVEDASGCDEAASGAAEAIRELAEEKAEAAANIEEGFGWATSQSEELTETAESLESWAKEFESIDWPEYPEPEEEDCIYCSGTGLLNETAEGDSETDPDEPCTQCDGEGTTIPEEPTEEQVEQWREEAQEAYSAVWEGCPV